MENHTRTRLLEQSKAAHDLVADIPEYLIKNPDTTFIDPFMGGGQYLAAVVKRCEKYHDRSQILPRIYGAETESWFTNRAILHNKLKGAHLTLNLNDFMGMQFDVVIGNPPYQDSSSAAKNVKLWPKFIKLSVGLLKSGGYISLVTPGSWAVFNSSQSQRQRNSIIDHIDLQQVVDANDSFNVGVSITRWSGIKRSYSGHTIAWGEDHDFSSGPYLTEDGQTTTNIHNKIIQMDHLKLVMGDSKVTSDECREDSGTVIHFSGPKIRYTSKNIDNSGVPKFVAPFSCSPYSRFFTTEAVGMLNMWMPCKESEFDTLSTIWDLKVVKFFINTFQKTSGFSSAVKRSFIPDFRGLNDHQAYEALGLTNDEIKMVEDHCS